MHTKNSKYVPVSTFCPHLITLMFVQTWRDAQIIPWQVSTEQGGRGSQQQESEENLGEPQGQERTATTVSQWGCQSCEVAGKCVKGARAFPFMCLQKDLQAVSGSLQGVQTFSLTRMAEHCSSTPISLWGFQVTELALKEAHDPLRRRYRSWERGNPLWTNTPPISTWVGNLSPPILLNWLYQVINICD